MILKMLTLFFAVHLSWAGEISINEVHIVAAPAWLTNHRVQKVVDRIQKLLEWDIRKVEVKWFTDADTFQKAHGFDSSVLAIARQYENAVYVGPKVNNDNFDGVFGHELSHVIVFQKYKRAIPKWLEEGLANYMANRGEIDYKWLASEPARDVKSMEHPFKAAASSGVNPKYHYMASSALMQMIAAHCDIHNLLQLSVGEKLEAYLGTFCGIDDINVEFQKWLKKKAM